MWSFTEARAAARAVRAADLGVRAAATIRPRGVLGVVRARAPLALLLYGASQDGLVVACDDGFAVLQPPIIDGADRSGDYRRRMLRAVDRHWDLLVLALPPAMVVLLAAAVTLLVPGTLIVAVSAVLLGVLWVTALMAGMLLQQLGSIFRMGAPSTPKHSRDAESLPGYHWSVPLVHQPDPDRADALVAGLRARLGDQLLVRAQESVRGQANVEAKVTGILVVLTSGVTTRRTQVAMAESVYASQGGPNDSGVIVMGAPSRMAEPAERPASAGGSFLLLYMFAVVVVIAVCAQFVATDEAAACQAALTSCDGHPATYGAAVRWLLHRLYFTDGDLAPMTVRAAVLGIVLSLLGPVGLLVAFVAGRQEYRRNLQQAERQKERLTHMAHRSRVLVLVVTSVERNAVLRAVRLRTNKQPGLERGLRTAFLLGSVGDTDVMLAQVGEAGTAQASGMLVSAVRLIEHLDPDYVILTGICFGLRPDAGQRIGDILVSRRVQSVDPKKVMDDRVTYRGVHVDCSPVLLDRFQAADVTWTGGRLHFGTLLSSNTLVNSTKLVEQLRTDFPDAIGGEMESVGVAEAVLEDFKPDWIVVKAISDWGYAKSDDWQEAAATNAAELVVEVLASGGLARRRAERIPGRA